MYHGRSIYEFNICVKTTRSNLSASGRFCKVGRIKQFKKKKKKKKCKHHSAIHSHIVLRCSVTRHLSHRCQILLYIILLYYYIILLINVYIFGNQNSLMMLVKKMEINYEIIEHISRISKEKSTSPL